MNWFIRKPFREQELFHAIEGCLGAQFEYQEEVSAAVQTEPKFPEESPMLTKQVIADLPDALRKRLWRSVTRCDVDEANEILNEAARSQPLIAEKLRIFLQDMKFGELLALLDDDKREG